MSRPRWHRSFYWRIAISFVVLLVVVLLGQSVMVSYMMTRPGGAFGPGNPNAAAAATALSLGSALEREPGGNLEALLLEATPNRGGQATFVVMKDGRVASIDSRTLSTEIQQQAAALLAGVPHDLPRDARPTGPVVSAPLLVRGELRGLVILPPPPEQSIFMDARRLLSLPSTLVLLAGAAAAAVVIFAPARRRLMALEAVTERFGAGDLSARAAEDGQDEITNVAASFNRMATELAGRSEALQISDRRRRQMLADVSHELRTPLSAISGYLDTLAMPDIALAPTERARYLDTVRHETDRLKRIVADLLDLAKYENGVASLELQVFAIERVFDHVIARHERDASAARITLSALVAEPVDQLIADPDRIEQVIDNLVANALRHTPPGGEIELRAEPVSGGCLLLVTDSGEGIPPEHLSHVFERFYKRDPARTAGAGGSGLGLSIAKAIVERHGGTIRVSSRPGRTQFVITLPERDQSSASANL